MSHGALRLKDEGGKARVLPAARGKILSRILRGLVRRGQFYSLCRRCRRGGSRLRLCKPHALELFQRRLYLRAGAAEHARRVLNARIGVSSQAEPQQRHVPVMGGYDLFGLLCRKRQHVLHVLTSPKIYRLFTQSSCNKVLYHDFPLAASLDNVVYLSCMSAPMRKHIFQTNNVQFTDTDKGPHPS